MLPQPLLNKKDSELVRSLNPYKVTTPISKPIIDLSSVEKLQKMVKHTKKEMVKMAKNLNFIEAARLRDKLQQLEEKTKKLGIKKASILLAFFLYYILLIKRLQYF